MAPADDPMAPADDPYAPADDPMAPAAPADDRDTPAAHGTRPRHRRRMSDPAMEMPQCTHDPSRNATRESANLIPQSQGLMPTSSRQARTPAPAAHPPACASHATERAIMAIAAGQHGVVSRRQLERAGIPTAVADRYIRIGRMTQLHRGVYQLGPALGPHARLVAATLACGDMAVLSHRSAAGLWRILGESADIVDVTVSGRAESRVGIRVHRAPLRSDEITSREGVRVTSPARTLYDLASMAAPTDPVSQSNSRVVVHRDVERALAEADAQRLVTQRAMLAMLDHHHGHGAGLLRELLESDVKPALTRSEAEERFLDLVRRGGVDNPAVNVMVERYEVDFLWRAERVIVEVDGRRYHASKRAFDNDRRRDAVLAAAGYTVMRVTWDHITREPEAVLVRLVRTLCGARR